MLIDNDEDKLNKLKIKPKGNILKGNTFFMISNVQQKIKNVKII